MRDDNMGNNNFGALPSSVFPNNQTTGFGTPVASDIVLPWGSALGAQRLGSGCDVAILPTAPKQVYVAYTQMQKVNSLVIPVIKVQASSDGGNTFLPQNTYTTPLPASLPSLSVNGEGTLAMLYLALNGLYLEVHFTKWFAGGFPATPYDQVLAKWPNNTPMKLDPGDPYVGDYIQVKSVGNNFYGAFCASGNPLVADFPSGVYYQRDVQVVTKAGTTVYNNFTLTANGKLWSATTGGVAVAASIDPFFFYDIAPEWIVYGAAMQLIPASLYDPVDPYSGAAHIAWPVLPTNYPPVQLQTSSTLGAAADWTVVTNTAIIQANGLYEALLDPSQEQQQFFRLKQNVSSGQFNLVAASDGEGSLSPNGVLTVTGGQNQQFTATASNAYGIATWYLDGAVVQSNNPTLTLSNINAGHTVLVIFAPTNDIGVTITGNPLQPGAATIAEYNPSLPNDLIYSIQVGNTGLGTVTGVTMSNLLPATVSLVSLTTSQGTVTNTGDLVTANIGTLLPGATALVQIDVLTPDGGSITDTVSVACSQFEPDLSNNTATNVNYVVAPVVVTTQPASQTVTNGGTAAFSVGVSGTPPIYYQWYYNETNVLAGATNSTLTLNNVSAANAGSFTVLLFQVFAPEDTFSATSADATLIVQ
jgi:uncharacterized repeat protein (TIGR01451 family)